MENATATPTWYVFIRQARLGENATAFQLMLDMANSPFRSSFGGIAGPGNILTLCLDPLLAGEIQKATPERIMKIAPQDWAERFPHLWTMVPNEAAECATDETELVVDESEPAVDEDLDQKTAIPTEDTPADVLEPVLDESINVEQTQSDLEEEGAIELEKARTEDEKLVVAGNYEEMPVEVLKWLGHEKCQICEPCMQLRNVQRGVDGSVVEFFCESCRIVIASQPENGCVGYRRTRGKCSKSCWVDALGHVSRRCRECDQAVKRDRAQATKKRHQRRQREQKKSPPEVAKTMVTELTPKCVIVPTKLVKSEDGALSLVRA